MNRRNRTQLALGILLLLFAAGLVAVKFQPDLFQWINIPFTSTLWVVIAGGIILLIGLLVGSPGMAVPACIVAGIGGILYYQETNSAWDSWPYMWTLIPGFVGIGNILAGLFGEDLRHSVRHGLNLIIISIVLFLVFASIFGGLEIFGSYKEYTLAGLLFLLGLWLILQGVIRPRRKE